MVLTLSVTGKSVYVDPSNIAVAIEEEIPDENNKRKKVKFTRIYFKGVTFPENVPAWVDVKEKIVEIFVESEE